MKKKWLLPLLRRRLLVALLILIQVVFLIYFLINAGYISSIVTYSFTAISVIVALFVASGRGESAYKLAWVFVLLSFPMVGGLLFLFFDNRFLPASLVKRVQKTEKGTKHLMYAAAGASATEEYPVTARYLTNYVGFPLYHDSQSTFLASGQDMLWTMKQELKKAKRYIFVEYFIIEHGEMWDGILEILLQKVKEGVVVRVLYDDMGCFLRLPHKYTKMLKKTGIAVAKFNPFVPFFSVEQNNRDHRKIMVIDGETAFTGGINLADEYLGESKRYGNWADSGVVIKGMGAWSFAVMFLQMWQIANRKQKDDFLAFLPTALTREVAEQNLLDRTKKKADACLTPQNQQAPHAFILPYADSPLDYENVGEQVYLQIIQNAKKYVYITTPYLIIDEKLISALTLAAKSGVDVRIITPHKWDKRIVHKTTRSYYYTLYESGVRLYEYTPGFMHAKMVVADDEIATVGSINFDYRSLFLHFECGAYLYKCETVTAVKDAILAYMDLSQSLTPRPPRKNIFARLYRAVLRLLSPLM